MVKHIAGLLLVFILSLSQTACEQKKSDAELKEEKVKTWRERQRQQAIKYYNELVKNYPDSPHVEDAKKKLDALGPAATPAKKGPAPSAPAPSSKRSRASIQTRTASSTIATRPSCSSPRSSPRNAPTSA